MEKEVKRSVGRLRTRPIKEAGSANPDARPSLGDKPMTSKERLSKCRQHMKDVGGIIGSFTLTEKETADKFKYVMASCMKMSKATAAEHLISKALT